MWNVWHVETLAAPLARPTTAVRSLIVVAVPLAVEGLSRVSPLAGVFINMVASGYVLHLVQSVMSISHYYTIYYSIYINLVLLYMYMMCLLIFLFIWVFIYICFLLCPYS